MTRFILVSLGFMAWAFYELSGGKDFDPDTAYFGTETASVVTDGDSTDETVGGAEPDVATRAAIDPSVGDLAIAVATKASLTSERAMTIEPSEPVSNNVGNGSLKVVALDMPEPAAARAKAEERIAAMDEVRVREMRSVTGNRVNMRNGPGTNYSVLARLDQGDLVEVLQEPGNGWVKLRVTDSGRVGWMADFLLASVQ